MSLRQLLLRLLGVAWVVVAATTCAWLLMRLLRPELFAGEDGHVVERLGHFLDRAFLHFDFGRDRGGSQRPVAAILRESLPSDAALMAGGLAFGFAAGAAGGLVCGRRPRGPLSRAVQAAGMLAMCTPVFVVGLGALLLLGQDIGVLPLGVPLRYVEFRDGPLRWLAALVTPWVVLGLPLAGMCLRVMLGEVVEHEHADHVRAARAKGLSERAILRRHVGPVALAPTAMLAGSAMPLLLTNAILVERVFSVPGVFSQIQRAVGTADVPLILGMTAAGALLIALSTLAFDLLIAWLDPRVREAASRGS